MSAVRIRMVARFGPPSVRTRWFVGSLVAHLAFTAAVAVWPARARPLRGPIGPRISVDLIGSLPGAKSAPPTRPAPSEATPPAPKPAAKKPPEPKEAALEPRKVEVREKTPKKKDPEPEPPAEPLDTGAAESTEAPETGAPSAATGGEGGTAGEGDGGVAGDIGGGSLLGSEYSWYGARVTAALRSQWRRPPLGNVRQSLTVVVAFDILRDGGVRNARIVESSGVPALDRSALRAVADAAPLPALPRTLSATSVPARFEFTWHPGES